MIREDKKRGWRRGQEDAGSGNSGLDLHAILSQDVQLWTAHSTCDAAEQMLSSNACTDPDTGQQQHEVLPVASPTAYADSGRRSRHEPRLRSSRKRSMPQEAVIYMTAAERAKMVVEERQREQLAKRLARQKKIAQASMLQALLDFLHTASQKPESPARGSSFDQPEILFQRVHRWASAYPQNFNDIHACYSENPFYLDPSCQFGACGDYFEHPNSYKSPEGIYKKKKRVQSIFQNKKAFFFQKITNFFVFQNSFYRWPMS